MEDKLSHIRALLWSQHLPRAPWSSQESTYIRDARGREILNTDAFEISDEEAQTLASYIAALDPFTADGLIWIHDRIELLAKSVKAQTQAGRACIAILDSLVARWGDDLDDVDVDAVALALAVDDFESNASAAEAIIHSVNLGKNRRQ